MCMDHIGMQRFNPIKLNQISLLLNKILLLYSRFKDLIFLTLDLKILLL